MAKGRRMKVAEFAAGFENENIPVSVRIGMLRNIVVFEGTSGEFAEFTRKNLKTFVVESGRVENGVSIIYVKDKSVYTTRNLFEEVELRIIDEDDEELFFGQSCDVPEELLDRFVTYHCLYNGELFELTVEKG